MGNHDLNAIAWYLPDPDNPVDHLRSHYSKKWGEPNRAQHAAFLKMKLKGNPNCTARLSIGFSRCLCGSIFLRYESFTRAGIPISSKYLTSILPLGGRLSKDLMPDATRERTGEGISPLPLFTAVEALTNGIEIPLAAGNSFYDKYGIERKRVRLRWWNEHAATYENAALLDDSLRASISSDPLPESSRVFAATDKPVFIGHYWRTGTPGPLTDKVACVDYSVGHGGPLVAYRWEGEAFLTADHFVRTDDTMR